MSEGVPSGLCYDREQAWKLLTEWTLSESLRKHALAVEICVRPAAMRKLTGWG